MGTANADTMTICGRLLAMSVLLCAIILQGLSSRHSQVDIRSLAMADESAICAAGIDDDAPSAPVDSGACRDTACCLSSRQQFDGHPPWQMPPETGSREPRRLIVVDRVVQVATLIKSAAHSSSLQPRAPPLLLV